MKKAGSCFRLRPFDKLTATTDKSQGTGDTKGCHRPSNQTRILNHLLTLMDTYPHLSF
jgi:hypothetical protein